MKKLLSLICMITCVFGLTACGSEENLTRMEQDKLAAAEKYATETVVPTLVKFMDGDGESMDGYTSEEVAHIVEQDYGLPTDGYAFLGAIESFSSAKASMGKVTGIGEAKAQIDGRQIIVSVQVQGAQKDAEAEVVLSNDMFLVLESASLNPISSMGELLGKAALNTLIGMGTVFVVLILISFIISVFVFIPKLQASFSRKNEAAASVAEPVRTEAPVVSQAGEDDLSGDLELVAVIAAAIAASEGAASTDGYVVRSIRRRANPRFAGR